MDSPHMPARAEQTLLDSENLEAERDRLKALLGSIPDEVWFCDLQGNVTMLNTSALQNLGFAAPEDLNGPVAEIIHEKLEAYCLDGTPLTEEDTPILRSLKGETVHLQEMVRNRRTQVLRYREVTSSPVRAQDNTIIGAVAIVKDITDQYLQEEALRKSQADLAHAQALARIGSWRLSIPQNTLVWSDETYRIFEIPQGTPMTDEAFHERVYTQDLENVNAAWAATVLGAPYDVEHRITTDGGIKWVRERAVLDFDAQGALRGAFGTVQDITERKQAEEALRKAHERAVWMARFPDENPNPVARISAGGQVLYCNPAAAALPGWELAVGQPLPAALLPLVGQAMACGHELEQDLQLAGRFYSISAMPFPQESYANFYGRDITARKQAEALLRESEARFHIALDAAPMNVFSYDAQGRYLWIYNPLGKGQLEGLLGKSDEELNPPENIRELTAAKQGVLENGQKLQKEIKLRWSDGKLSYYILTLAPTMNEQGDVSGMIGSAFDITEQREVQEEIMERRAQVEVQRRLLEYREQERQIIARALHDGPLQELASLIFNTQYTKEAISDPAIAAELDLIGNGLKRTLQNLRGMINDLRPPSLIRFGLAKTLRITLEDFREKHPGIQVEADLEDDGSDLTEQGRLNLFQIVQEALENAIAHANATKIAVRFECGGQRCVLEIRDNGQGFPVAGNLVEYTAQGYFGLAGMKERAEAIGGHLAIQSEEKKGTVVSVTVPIGKESGG